MPYLKLSNFVIKILSIEPIIALFDNGVICTRISHQLFLKFSCRLDMTQKSLKVNTASGTTIGIGPLELNIDNHVSMHNYIICTKLKQPLIMKLDFAKKYGIGVDWVVYGTLFL